jgi:hypothetical protein
MLPTHELASQKENAHSTLICLLILPPFYDRSLVAGFKVDWNDRGENSMFGRS